MSLTRRHLAALLTAAPLATSAAQSDVRPPQPASAPAAGNPNELLRKAEGEVRDVSAKLAQIQIAQSLEPAFVFRP